MHIKVNSKFSYQNCILVELKEFVYQFIPSVFSCVQLFDLMKKYRRRVVSHNEILIPFMYLQRWWYIHVNTIYSKVIFSRNDFYIHVSSLQHCIVLCNDPSLYFNQLLSQLKKIPAKYSSSNLCQVPGIILLKEMVKFLFHFRTDILCQQFYAKQNANH